MQTWYNRGPAQHSPLPTIDSLVDNNFPDMIHRSGDSANENSGALLHCTGFILFRESHKHATVYVACFNIALLHDLTRAIKRKGVRFSKKAPLKLPLRQNQFPFGSLLSRPSIL